MQEHAYLGFQSMEQEVIDMSLKETLVNPFYDANSKTMLMVTEMTG